MKRKLLISLLVSLAIGIALVSCFGPKKIYLRSMVTTYYRPGELHIEKLPDNMMAVRFTDVSLTGSYDYSPVIYDRLCQKHGDMSYEREITFPLHRAVPPYQFMSIDLLSIEIISDTDWGGEYPAGSSLNDLVKFHSLSPVKYIRSGYTSLYDWRMQINYNYAIIEKYFKNQHYYNATDGKTEYHYIGKKVSDLKPEDMMLLGNGEIGYEYDTTLAVLEFTSLPVENKAHNITVTITTDEAGIFSDTIQMVFK